MRRSLLLILLSGLPALSFSQVHAWAHGFGTTTIETGKCVTTDGGGHVYVGGDFSNTVDFDPGPAMDNLTAALMSDAYITKYGPNGQYLWGMNPGGSGNETINDITTDATGVYVLGRTQSTSFVFDPPVASNVGTGIGGWDIFLAKYDFSGVYQWGFVIGSTSDDNAYELEYDPMWNNIIIYGEFEDSMDVDPSGAINYLTPQGGSDVFVAQYNAGTGAYVGSFTIGSTAFDYAGGMGIHLNDIFITLSSNSSNVDMDPGPSAVYATTNGGTDAFVISIDLGSYSYNWGHAIGGSGTDVFRALDVDANGDVVVGGYTNSTLVNVDPIGAATVTTNGGDDIIFAKYAGATGNYNWANVFGASNNDWLMSLDITDNDEIAVTGYFSGNVDFDNGAGSNILNGGGTADQIFMGLYGSSGQHQWATDFGNTLAQDWGYDVHTREDSVYISGYHGGTEDWDPGPGSNFIGYTGTFDAFVGKYVNCYPASLPSTGGNAPTICQGQSVDLEVLSGNLNDNLDWEWYKDSCGGPPLFVGGGPFTVFPTQTTTYYVRGAGGCPQAGPCEAVTVNVTPAPFSFELYTEDFCLPDTGLIIFYNVIGLGPFSYSYDGGNFFVPDSIYGGIQFTGGGTYDLVIADANGCSVDTSVFIDFTLPNPPTITANNPYCDRQGTIDGSSTGTIIWLNPDTTIIVAGQNSINVPAHYSSGEWIYAINIDSGCWSYQDSAQLIIVEDSILGFTGDTSICAGYTAQITAQGSGTFTWLQPGSILDPTGPTIQVQPDSSMWLTAIMNVQGCAFIDSVYLDVYVDESCVPIEVNAFSPNADGINDVWIFPLAYDYPENTLFIYNRWGDQIRAFDGYNNRDKVWNGQRENGKPVPAGTYFYYMRIPSIDQPVSGWVQVTLEE